jgi:hypothetical protein
MTVPVDLLGWAQLLAWCIVAAVAAMAGVLLTRLGLALDRFEELEPDLIRALRAMHVLPSEYAGTPAPSTFPPRRSNPEVVALERRHPPSSPPSTLDLLS